MTEAVPGIADREHDARECEGNVYHCFVHSVDEQVPPGTEPYKVCFECKHTYPTADDLLSAWNAMVDQLARDSERFGGPPMEPPPPETNPDLIFFCPHCSHDW